MEKGQLQFLIFSESMLLTFNLIQNSPKNRQCCRSSKFSLHLSDCYRFLFRKTPLQQIRLFLYSQQNSTSLQLVRQYSLVRHYSLIASQYSFIASQTVLLYSESDSTPYSKSALLRFEISDQLPSLLNVSSVGLLLTDL